MAGGRSGGGARANDGADSDGADGGGDSGDEKTARELISIVLSTEGEVATLMEEKPAKAAILVR